jgi:hypothetical protein
MIAHPPVLPVKVLPLIVLFEAVTADPGPRIDRPVVGDPYPAAVVVLDRVAGDHGIGYSVERHGVGIGDLGIGAHVIVLDGNVVDRQARYVFGQDALIVGPADGVVLDGDAVHIHEDANVTARRHDIGVDCARCGDERRRETSRPGRRTRDRARR